MYIGASLIRKEALEKVTGVAKYMDDYHTVDMLHAQLIISEYAHAHIQAIDTSEAQKVSGVRAILLGQPSPLTGEEIRDRPPIAFDKVRYHGEPIAVIVADTAVLAKRAADLVHITYKPLQVVNSPRDAIAANAPLIHENLANYKRIEHVYPEPNTNIADRTKIRKGNMERGWEESDVTVEGHYAFSPSDHAAMETRCVTASISPDGYIHIATTSQAPYMVKKLLGSYFDIEKGKIIVSTPLVGGGYGGKVAVQLELIAYMASKAVGGKPVKLYNSREEDMISSPVHIGLDAVIKLGCSKDGLLKATQIKYLWDCGAYSDKGATISRAGAVTCTGPYDIENIWCDSLCIYTNHPYATAYRGFSHPELLFAFERTMDMLAEKLGMDPMELRLKNAILPGHKTPTQVVLNHSNVGNVPDCINKLKRHMNWDEGQCIPIDSRFVRAKGMCCIWKTSTIDTNSTSGVVLTFNPDGSINLLSGLVEIGTGTKTVLAQILAEQLKMDVNQIHVRMEVDTQTTPEHWKTVASRGTLMAGNAVLRAGDDAIRQLKNIASHVLACSPSDLEVAHGKVSVREEPTTFLNFKDIAYGYQYPNGHAIGGQILARGNYTLRHLTHIDHETGAGKPGPEWTVGAQGIEIEYDTRDYTYRIVKAYSVIDIGKVLNYKGALGQVMGAMSMGIGFASKESFVFDDQGIVQNPQLRTYVPPHYGDHPQYIVDFVETPHIDAPFGARGVGEHGLLGMPAALANALSKAAGVQLNSLPLLPETIWSAKKAGEVR